MSRRRQTEIWHYLPDDTPPNRGLGVLLDPSPPPPSSVQACSAPSLSGDRAELPPWGSLPLWQGHVTKLESSRSSGLPAPRSADLGLEICSESLSVDPGARSHLVSPLLSVWPSASRGLDPSLKFRCLRLKRVSEAQSLEQCQPAVAAPSAGATLPFTHQPSCHPP